MPSSETPETYRPVSLLAGTAITLAGLYGLVVVFGALVAMGSGLPLLLPVWTFGLPGASLLLAWMARSQIQSSEGSMTGLALTRWSVWLSIFFGLSYGAYYTATGLAVRNQADHFARLWLKEITEAKSDPGKLNQAFYLTRQPPRKALTPDALREMLEIRNLAADLNAPGTLSGFTQTDFVRLLLLAGDKAQVELQGVNGWGYEGGGYLVSLTYRIETPLATFHLRIATGGVESRSRDEPGRQWYVKLEGTYPVNKAGEFRREIPFTQEGEALWKVRESALQAGASWFELLRNGRIHEAYLQTGLAGESKKGRQVEQAGLLILAAGPLARPAAVAWQDLDRWQKFLGGGLTKEGQEPFWKGDEKTFWAVKDKGKSRAAALEDVLNLLTPARRLQSIKMSMAQVPLSSADGDRMVIRHDCQLTFPPRTGRDNLPILVEARLVLSANVPNPGEPKAHGPWRVDAVELLRTRTVARPSGPGQK